LGTRVKAAGDGAFAHAGGRGEDANVKVVHGAFGIFGGIARRREGGTRDPSATVPRLWNLETFAAEESNAANTASSRRPLGRLAEASWCHVR